ncbi:MAG: PspA/IM30 family protein [Actinobacteria bacterium ATB1]|nr:PspA/IM30 family protein [Actinobacteria bacterium ATB1]
MGKFFKKLWRYMTAALTGKFEELADPKIQIEQAIDEAEKQHQMLTQQAANVIAHQKDTELQLNRAIEQVEKLSSSSRQALLMADQARKAGNQDDANKYEQAAQAFAQRLIVAEQEVESLKAIHLQATDAAGQAKKAVQSNRMALEKKYTEKTKLLSQLDQAKMQERMSQAMASMSATVGDEVPTLDEVRRKIEQRYARALGAAELHADSVEGKMLEVEQASIDLEATARLDEIRSQLGIETVLPQASIPAPAAETEPAVPTPAEAEPQTQPQAEAESSGS